MITLYNTDPETGKYINDRDTEARVNPMYREDTHDVADKYLYNPKTSSLTPPPDCGLNECAVLEGGQWVIKNDFVGQHYYMQNGERVEITEIGTGIPAGCIQQDPPDAYHTTHNGFTWLEDESKRKTDKKQEYWQEYLDYLDQGFDFQGTTYQCRPDDINDWLMLKNHIETLPGDTAIQIRAANNSMHTITVTDYLSQFAPALGQHVLTARQAYWAKVDVL